ncbi:unnamed protein product [Protopolystoma xenopodis]|uniref:Uncharacterized protein n=1 Tax=Protopolystoma xenopodis TaxID=117903 RepID=A0A3S5CIC9_9PLAT|nr:unnamed protein product [Protopolystoma xenopodis]
MHRCLEERTGRLEEMQACLEDCEVELESTTRRLNELKEANSKLLYQKA